MKRYVALGSSMAAGPGIRPRAAGAPRWSGRSARNYAHLVAARCGYDLVDVTFSGATTAHVLTERQHGAAPQIAALDGSESLVTVTIGGNDVGYIPLLTVAALPRPLRRLPLLGDRIAELLDAEARNGALEAVFESLCAVGTAVRQRCAEARIFFVDYLTMLPPAGVPAAPLSAADADLGRHVATTPERMTAAAARATGRGLIRAAGAIRSHPPPS
ncbi:SGNH/GDSL hydrolase family protein, partial [Mycobacterium avium]|uniref:SGNH/GDSL hydrolase family protein n=1 Tax=Mycobacterium avium TaxID=1764 RepID=UPI001E4C341D